MFLENGWSGNALGWRFPTARGGYFHNSENISSLHADVPVAHLEPNSHTHARHTHTQDTHTQDTHFAAKDSYWKKMEKDVVM